MKIFKHITLLRCYTAICLLALSAFAYAEYYGYELLGSDENGQRSNAHTSSGSRANHK
ncbi:MAG TPA: hypothetical protein VN030_04435 [Cellvibrio sp.]|nr:hypothetical protein [Cellvibrio sp.]